MRKILALLTTLALAICFAGCSTPAATSQTTGTSASETESEITEATTETTLGNKTLVIYFSATGTTKGIAGKIAGITGADLYEIRAEIPYTEEDRTWTDSNSRCSVEQNDPAVRPAIGSEKINLDGYSIIYIGYPIWFGQEPRIMDSFVESYDFDGITVIPFCTSGSSGIGQSGRNLASNAGSGNWIDGQRFAGDASEEEIKEWIETI